VVKGKLLRLLVVGGAVLAGDQLSKAWAVSVLQHSCETLERVGAGAPRIVRCHPSELTVDLGSLRAKELRFNRGPVPFFSLKCKDDAACLRGAVQLGEERAGATVTRIERDAVEQALLMLRGIPIEADHLTTGGDGQLYRIAVVGADGATSSLRLRYRSPGKAKEVIAGWLRLRYVENPGAAWGFLADGDDSFRGPFFLAVSIIASIFLLYVYRRAHESQHLFQASLALVLGGALGNFADRLRIGRVVDFIEVHYEDKARWPTFNVADVAISVGVALLLLDGVRTWRRQRAHDRNPPPVAGGAGGAAPSEHTP